MSSPVLSVVVLAWDQLPLTQACVASIREHTDVPYELIVVDNGSAPEAAQWAQEHADIAVLNDENRGFAPGMNQGAAQASGTYVAFVNNDTVMPSGWASALVGVFDVHPGAGIVLPAVTAAGNPTAVRTEPGTELVVIPPYRALPSGVVYVMPRAFFAEVGGWDERYLVASREDVDLLFATWVRGRDVVLDERVLVDHVSSATANAQLDDREKIWMANWAVFVEKWAGDDGTVTGPDVTSDRREAAAAAAHWLDRWYTAYNETVALQREVRDTKRKVAALERSLAKAAERTWTSRLRSAAARRFRR